ncbi:MAG: type II toxin-antitoxin system HicA family toxin [Gammaproteobacteria bacterium]|nr:HicA [Gammaproteobacteria bacterium]MDP6095993.1 type II toxin-antitoxin system HicA family toxin [Gammaproteobacteria bacterium]
MYRRPTSGNINWSDIESLFRALGADVSERAGSRVAVVVFDEVRVYHRPHPSPNTDKGAIASIRRWFEENEVVP